MKTIAMGALGGIAFGFAIQFLALQSKFYELRAELIQRGIAEWVADKNGNTTFQLKEEEE